MENIVRLITNEDALDRARAERGRLLEKTDRTDLPGEFGNKTTASLVMSRPRPLTLPIIRRLAARLTLPIAVLAREYALAPGSAPDDALSSAIA